ncbi:hypothetical protein HanPI659440_Chr09g0342081 [Helianthus annuus]|nr:hypothetical protein HanPI659440_Chr09g0342081 [Helianthus annuus]
MLSTTPHTQPATAAGRRHRPHLRRPASALPPLFAADGRRLAPPPSSRFVSSFTSTCSFNLGVSTG